MGAVSFIAPGSENCFQLRVGKSMSPQMRKLKAILLPDCLVSSNSLWACLFGNLLEAALS